MIRTEYGFVVMLGKQVLISGDWGSDDCDWKWDIDYNYFMSRDEAEKFFKKSKKIFRDGSVDHAAMYNCDMTFDGDTMIGSGLGDPIKEYVCDNGKVIVIEDL